jgi:peptidoglycan hydrolase-like protein with peptidoglycan-binding domain
MVAAAIAVLVMAGPAAAAALPAGYPHQSHGNRGVNVKALQHLLRAHGATIPMTGLFDNATVAAVRAFQWANDLPGTGEADSPTWTALRIPISTGMTGEAVLAAQRLLNEKRLAGLPLTAVYDAATKDAVLAFQRHAGITATGVLGPVTWRALLAHLELPVWGKSMCDYSVGNGAANWGTAAAIGEIQAAAHVVVDAGYGRIALGDIGLEHGGDIPGHETHEQGMDVDIRPMRDANDQCRWGTNWRYTSYDRAATRALIKAIRATAIGHVKLIYFNDPVLIREGLTTPFTGHDDHLHIRYCERVYPLAMYTC